MIKEKFYPYQDRIAAGLAGEGSECLGFDDALSRDHDWGPGFCLWLEDADYDDIGKLLQEEYEKLPRVFMGFSRKTAPLSHKKVGVFRITDFYRRFTGLPLGPETLGQWYPLSDEYLSACTNGKVFYDPLSKFSDIRKKLLKFYPEDLRLLKIASRCMTCSQSGQYNFMRSVNRGEMFAAFYSQTAFCSDIIGLVFLLKKRFSPFYKWKHRAVKDLGSLGKSIHDGVSQMITATDTLEKKDIIENMCTTVISELRHQKISDAKSSFLLDHGIAVQKGITDETLRKKDVWGGC